MSFEDWGFLKGIMDEIEKQQQELTSVQKAKELEHLWNPRIRLAARAVSFVSGTLLVSSALYHVFTTHDMVVASTLATMGGGLLVISLTGSEG